MAQPRSWYYTYLQQLQAFNYWSSKTETESPEEMRRLYTQVQNRRQSLEQGIKDYQETLGQDQSLTPAARAHIEQAVTTLEGSHAAMEFVEDLLDKTCDPDIDQETWPEGYVLAKIGWRIAMEIARIQLLLLGEEP